MKSSFLVLALLAAAPAQAQMEVLTPLIPQPGETQFRQDLADLNRLATAAALVHERTGAFPATAFALLGSPEAQQTGARDFPLSALEVVAAGDSLALRYVPLPVPYVREDLNVTASVRPDGAARYRVRHEMVRTAAPEAGGRRIDYGTTVDATRNRRVALGRGFGTLCVETDRARASIAAGAFDPAPTSVSSDDLTIRVRETASGRVLFESTSEAAR